MKKIYVGNLNFYAKKEEIIEFFEQYGTVLDVYLPMNAKGTLNRGFAFITFKEEADAERCKIEANEKEFKGRIIRVDEAREKSRTW